jgi:hypothetical protein
MDEHKQEDDQGVLNVNPGQESAQSVDDRAVMKPFNERETMDGYKNKEEQLGSTGQKLLRKGTQNAYAKGVENRIPEGHCKEVEGSKVALIFESMSIKVEVAQDDNSPGGLSG